MQHFTAGGVEFWMNDLISPGRHHAGSVASDRDKLVVRTPDYQNPMTSLLRRDLILFGSLRLPIKFHDFKAYFSPRRDLFVPPMRRSFTQGGTYHAFDACDVYCVTIPQEWGGVLGGGRGRRAK